jgi:hypothetical protein
MTTGYSGRAFRDSNTRLRKKADSKRKQIRHRGYTALKQYLILAIAGDRKLAIKSANHHAEMLQTIRLLHTRALDSTGFGNPPTHIAALLDRPVFWLEKLIDNQSRLFD